MSVTTRTPGPWKVQPMPNVSRIIGGPTLHKVAEVPARRQADARLIAAAPDLLAICQCCLAEGYTTQIRAAMRTLVRALEATDG